MKTVQKITSLFLAAVFLISSLGFTANKMVCLKSGRVKVSLVHAKECCSDERTAIPVVKEKCCDVLNNDFHLADLQTTQKLSFEKPFATQLFFIPPGFSCSLISVSKPAVTASADLPPPLYGRTLLHFISVLTI